MNRVFGRVVGLVVATVVASSLLAAPVVAAPAANPSAVVAASDWNYYSDTLPAFVSGPTAFEVVIQGSAPVCSMTFQGQTKTAAPWSFTYDPTNSNRNRVDIVQCDGSEDYYSVYADIPFVLSPTIVYSGNGDSNREVSGRNDTDLPATFVITAADGTVIASQDVAPQSRGTITLDPKSVKKTTAYTATMSTPDGLSMSAPVTIAKGWVPFYHQKATFAPCSVVPWYFDKTGQPKSGKLMESDIKVGLARLSKETGLTFVKADSPDAALLTFDWEKMGSRGPSAMGGWATNGDKPATGSVSFNSQDRLWAANDRTKGLGPWSGRGQGPAGRGWLVIHEVMHAMGFGHTTSKTSIMHPTNYGQYKFTKGDLEGLQSLYKPSTCSR